MELRRNIEFRFLSSAVSMDLLANACRLILRITAPILLLASISIAADKPRRVLLLDSFENGFGRFEVVKATLRSELRKQSPEPLAFYELSVVGDRDEHSFLNYVPDPQLETQAITFNTAHDLIRRQKAEQPELCQ